MPKQIPLAVCHQASHFLLDHWDVKQSSYSTETEDVRNLFPFPASCLAHIVRSYWQVASTWSSAATAACLATECC